MSTLFVSLHFVSTHLCNKLQNPRKEVNVVLKKEAAYFGDIVILPFMDRYELVVLKTIAICEFGVSSWCILLSFPFFERSFQFSHSCTRISFFWIYVFCWVESLLKVILILQIHAGAECVSCLHHEMWWWHICQSWQCLERNWWHLSQKVTLYGQSQPPTSPFEKWKMGCHLWGILLMLVCYHKKLQNDIACCGFSNLIVTWLNI